MIIFTPNNWYWFVGGDQTQVFSSASNSFVPIDDPIFVTWSADSHNAPNNISSMLELRDVLINIGVIPQPNAPVSLRQAHLAIIQAGLKSQVDALIAADTTGALDAWWNYSTEIHRYHPLVLQLAVQLGLSNNQLDILFTTAFNL
jgi:hypothetical protein